MLGSIIGLQIQEIYIYKSILCLSIGECINQKTKIYRFDLEIQAPFRFIQKEKIIFGSYEKLYMGEESDIGLIPLPIKILKTQIESLGDLFVELERGIVLEVFIDTLKDSENWRLSDNLKGLEDDIVFNQKEEFFAQKAQKYKIIEKFLIRNAY